MVSQLGSAVTDLAVPLVAVLSLNASAAEMGGLGAARTAAFIAVGLLAGVVVDRSRRRTVLVLTAFASAVVVGSIPLASAAGVLTMAQLYVVSFLAGCLMVIEGVAFQAILLPLLGRARLTDGNATIWASASVTGTIGPGLAGILIQLVTAPIAIVADAISFVFCGALTLLVRVEESAPPARAAGQRIWHDVAEGLRYVFGEASLRGLAIGGAIHNFFSNGTIISLYVLYATQTLHLTPAQLGLAISAGGPGSFLASLVAARYGRRFGMRATLAHMQMLTGVARVFVPLASLVSQPLIALAVGEFVLGVVRAIANVNQLSMRMALTPDHLQGRMNASVRFLIWAVVPFGALLGGVAADRYGLIPTLVVAVAGTFASTLGYLFIPRDTRAT